VDRMSVQVDSGYAMGLAAECRLNCSARNITYDRIWMSMPLADFDQDGDETMMMLVMGSILRAVILLVAHAHSHLIS